jgi:hypothetical protein
MGWLKEAVRFTTVAFVGSVDSGASKLSVGSGEDNEKFQ